MTEVTKPKALAKALHTVTVLVRVAQHVMLTNKEVDEASEALDIALQILGYDADNCPDKDGCYAKARAQLVNEMATKGHPAGWAVAETSVEDDVNLDAVDPVTGLTFREGRRRAAELRALCERRA
jgi:hypothetical protein